MDRKQVLHEMKESIGTKDPIIFFAKMVDVFSLLFDRLESLEQDNELLRVQTALAIKWEPAVARDMLDSEIAYLREDRDTYHVEISALKKARMEDSVTQNYESFCKFWEDTLGYHPFMEYR